MNNALLVAIGVTANSLYNLFWDVKCRLLELHRQEVGLKLVVKELLPLQGVGLQNCLAFSVDGSKFATGGAVSRIFEFSSYEFG